MALERAEDEAGGTTTAHLVNGSDHLHGNSNVISSNQTVAAGGGGGPSPRRFRDFLRRPSKTSFVWSGVSRAAAVRGFPKASSLSHCCETIQEYATPPNVTVDGKVYRVVHLRQAFQFIPVAKCRQGTACSHGECVERYRAHWVLVYNATKTHGQPPVSFTPIEVPSHCECLNVGRP